MGRRKVGERRESEKQCCSRAGESNNFLKGTSSKDDARQDFAAAATPNPLQKRKKKLKQPGKNEEPRQSFETFSTHHHFPAVRADEPF